MRRLISNLRSDGERGATAIVVALLMTVLLGFAGLAVDLGASYAKHTELQNGADAAALALAQEFGADKCVDTGSAVTDATTWVRQNVNKDTADAEGLPDCLADYKLRVIADATLDHWFMPVVGKSSSDLAADATVEWGVPVAGTTIPLTIAQCSFENQAGAPYLDETVTIWMPDPSASSVGGDDPCGWHDVLPSGGFGVLDNNNCNATIAVPEWEVGSAPGGSGWSNCDVKPLLNQTHLIPIYGDLEWSGNGQNATYRILKFAAFTLEGYKFQQGKAGSGGKSCETPAPSWSDQKNCIVGTFIEYVELEDVDFELVPPEDDDTAFVIRLVD